MFTIIVDNASPNDVVLTYLEKKYNNIFNGQFLHIRCVAHILNLIVSNGLKECKQLVPRVRWTVRYIRSPPSRLEKFKECVKVEKIECKSLLCLDVSTRWNTTYLMFDTTQKFEKFFVAYDDLDPHFHVELSLGDGHGVLDHSD